MIRKLGEEDRQTLMELVGRQPSLNLFIIGDVENFGFDAGFQELWGQFGEDGRMKAALLRYYGSYLPYAEGPFDVEGFAALMRADDEMEMMSGPSQVTEALREAIPFKKVRQLYFAELRRAEARPVGTFAEDDSPATAEELPRRATTDDVERICALLDQIREFDSSSAASMRESMWRTLSSGTGRTYFLERDGKIVAVASTTAENSMSAMVVGVATHPDYRGQGLATRIVSRLCADVAAEGRTLCLFYDNPSAGEIYKRLGFRDIGMWSMMYR